MKKTIIILSIVMLLLSPALAGAQSKEYKDLSRIINEKTESLQLQINNLQSSQGTACSCGAVDNNKIQNLETRVTALEKMVNLIQQNVMSVLQSVINFLKK